MKLYLNSLIVAVVSFFWSYIYYAGGLYPEDYTRPFVYRQLVPLLARGIEFLGVPAGVALVVVMTLSGVGFYLALRKLAQEFYHLSNKQELYLVAGVLGSMLVMGAYRKPYDLMTALLFTLAFRYMWRGRSREYFLVFVLSCVNRETTFLLILLYVVFSWLMSVPFWQVFKMTVCQVMIFVLITYVLRIALAEAPGSGLWIEPAENIIRFTDQPYRFLLHLGGAFLVLWWVFREEPKKPTFWLVSFVVISPVLTLMYLVCGQAFELRAFWEISPLVIVLSIPKP